MFLPKRGKYQTIDKNAILFKKLLKKIKTILF